MSTVFAGSPNALLVGLAVIGQIVTNLTALHQLYAGNHQHPGLMSLIGEDQNSLAIRIENEFQNVLQLASSIGNLADAVADPDLARQGRTAAAGRDRPR